FSNFFMSPWHCSDFLLLHLTRVGGSPSKGGLQGIHILSSKIDRNLSFWPGRDITNLYQSYIENPEAGAPPPVFFALDQNRNLANMSTDAECRCLLNRWQRHLFVQGTINIEHCTIGQDVILTGVNVKNER